MSMKFSIPTPTLKKAVSLVARAVQKRAVLPVLSNIAIEALPGEVCLTATDLELGISVVVPAEVKTEGAICVPGTVFDATCKTLKGTDVSLALKESALTITCGSYKGRIAGLPFDEFPPTPKIEGAGIDLPDFKRAVAVVAPASSDDEDTRPTLTAVLFESLPGSRFALVAADGFRLTRYILDGVKTNGEVNLLIPGSHLETVARVVGDGEVSLFPGKTVALRWTAGEMSVTATIALMSGQFPDYKQIIPTASNAKATFTLPGGSLVDAVKRVSIIANEDGTSRDQGGGTLRLTAENGSLRIEGEVDQLGQGTDQVDAVTEGETKIALASRFTLDAAAPWPGQIKFHFYGEQAPLLALPVDGSCETVIMPRATV